MDPITTAIMTAAVQALVSAGASAAMPKRGMTQPGQIPQLGEQPVDFNALVGPQQQQPSQLPKLQLQSRLPRY
jgi:hypothetical protein